MTSTCSLRMSFLIYILLTFGFEEILTIKVESYITDTKQNKVFDLESRTKLKQDSKQVLGLDVNVLYRQRRDTQRNNPCEQFGSCKSNLGKTLPVCYCDSKCGIFNDCCYDATNETEFAVLELNDSTHLSCNHEILTAIPTAAHIGIYFIAECPAPYSVKEVMEKCERKEDIFPVTSPDGITYHNIYCAICNNVLEYKVWSFQFVYNDFCTRDAIFAKTNYTMKQIEWVKRNCNHIYKPPNEVTLRFCFIESISRSTTLPCPKFMNPVLVLEEYNSRSNALVRNIYCVREQNKTTSMPSCVEPGNYEEGTRHFGGIFDMVGMFNIRPAFEILGQKKCQAGYVFSASKDLCLPEDCDKDEKAIEEKCTFETLKNALWRIDNVLTFIADGIVDFITFNRILVLFTLSLPEKYELSIGFSRFGYKCQKVLNHPEKLCCFVQNLNTIIGRELTVEEVNQFISSADLIQWTFKETQNMSTLQVSRDIGQIEKVCSLVKNGSNVPETSRITPAGLKMIQDILLFTNERSFKPEIPLWLNIEIVKINDKEGLKAIYNVTKWEKVYGSVHRQEMDSEWSATTVLTYVTLGASSISLLFTMVVYKYLGLSSTSPGIISQNMMGTLLAAQLLFLSGAGANAVKEICLAIGIISHYIWLSAFTWITLFMVNVLKTMRRMYTCPGVSFNNSKLSNLMYCFGYLLPLTIVLPCAVLEIFTDTNIGYTDRICFPTGYPANIFAFSLPILVSLIINLVALAITSFSITRFNNTKALSSSIQGMESFIPIYIRLISICSFPWIIGMLSDILDLDFLRYLFIVLAGSQGTFVSVSFLTAKSVRTKLRNCLRTRFVEAPAPLPLATVSHNITNDSNIKRISKEKQPSSTGM